MHTLSKRLDLSELRTLVESIQKVMHVRARQGVYMVMLTNDKGQPVLSAISPVGGPLWDVQVSLEVAGLMDLDLWRDCLPNESIN